jgi:SAM-dependent methyltransferase
VAISEFGRSIRSSYSPSAAKYRSDDEIEIRTENHRHPRAILSGLCLSFGRSINVMDVGCGTGRYFYCLKNVNRLVGLDITEEMLKMARNPVRREAISIGKIELRCGNAFTADFPSQSFDLIYSLGMFGYGCPLTPEILDRFYEWLAPGGRLFFDAVDVATLPLWYRAKCGIRHLVTPLLAGRLKNAAAPREKPLPFFVLTKKELERTMQGSPFAQFSVTSQVCQSPLWRGVHLECEAIKPVVLKPKQAHDSASVEQFA